MTRGAATAAEHARTDVVANLVWIDAREAILLEWRHGAATTQRFESDVPGHHHSTGHVRHDPSPGSGGAGPPRAAGETHRIEHLTRFVEDVAAAVPTAGDILVLGPGTVRERLAERLLALDVRHERVRIVCQPSGPRTEPQLIARLREMAGSPPRRRVRSGAPRVAPVIRRASGSLVRVAEREFDRFDRRRPPIEPDLELEAEAGLESDAADRETDDGSDTLDARAGPDADESVETTPWFGGPVPGAGVGPGEPGSS